MGVSSGDRGRTRSTVVTMTGLRWVVAKLDHEFGVGEKSSFFLLISNERVYYFTNTQIAL